MRITVTGGRGRRSAPSAATTPPTAIVALGELPGASPTCDVVTVPWPAERARRAGRAEDDVLRARTCVALAYAAERGGSEAIFGNLAGNLCEGTGTNVFVVTGGRLVTPPLSAGLPGRGDPGAGDRVGRRRGGRPAADGAGRARTRRS